MKTEVYSWRLSGELKAELERAAHLRKASASAILEMAVRDWLKKGRTDTADDEVQRKLHAEASDCLGALAGRNPLRAETARDAIRKRLAGRRGR